MGEQQSTTERFPLDYYEWRKQWDDWRQQHAADLKPTSKRFEGKNFLADDVLGTWRINGRTVELSEVVFPNLSERDENGQLIREDYRRIGITYGIGVDGAGAVVGSFAELEQELGLVS